jgi:hypothetical protein
MAVDISVSTGGALKAGVPHKLFHISPQLAGAVRNVWDVSPDGQRFLINSTQQASNASVPLTVIVNWLSKAKAK